MLSNLKIKNLAIIDELEVEFGPGLNVLTGETGAGKTILIEALKLVLGCRAQSDLIRSGFDSAEVSAMFDASKLSQDSLKMLSELGIEAEGELIINRVVSSVGKSRLNVNCTPVTTAWLKNFSEKIIDIASQHEFQFLLEPANHARLLDEFGGYANLLEDYLGAHKNWQIAEGELKKLKMDKQQAGERLDFLRYQLNELEAAALGPGEDVEIDALRRRLKNASVLESKIGAAEALLYSASPSALGQLDAAISNAAQCVESDSVADGWRKSLSSARAEVEDVARDMKKYISSLGAESANLEEVEERFHLVKGLLKKYGPTMDDCIKRQEQIAAEINSIENYDEVLAEKEKKLAEAALKRREVGKTLASERKKVAKRMSQAIAVELSDLGMPKVKFSVAIKDLEEVMWNSEGPVSCEFLFSPNVGEPLRALTRIASGGELSRVMLALKGALAKKVKMQGVSVFDEVDSGIGGAVASVVGKKLKNLAATRQVVCITHLPQVAVFADVHMKILKQVQYGRTVTRVESLSKEDRVNEVARMLGGLNVSATTVAHAKEMLAHS